jgi:hypothetical protein
VQFTRRKGDFVAGLLWDRVSHAAVFYCGAIFAVAGSVGSLAEISEVQQVRKPA